MYGILLVASLLQPMTEDAIQCMVNVGILNHLGASTTRFMASANAGDAYLSEDTANQDAISARIAEVVNSTVMPLRMETVKNAREIAARNAEQHCLDDFQRK